MTDTVTLWEANHPDDEAYEVGMSPRTFRKVPWCHTHRATVDPDGDPTKGICEVYYPDTTISEPDCVWGVALVEVTDDA